MCFFTFFSFENKDHLNDFSFKNKHKFSRTINNFSSRIIFNSAGLTDNYHMFMYHDYQWSYGMNHNYRIHLPISNIESINLAPSMPVFVHYNWFTSDTYIMAHQQSCWMFLQGNQCRLGSLPNRFQISSWIQHLSFIGIYLHVRD